MALFENIQYRDDGMMMNNSFMQYKIPTRIDMGKIQVEFESTYEPTGPFGAKSIGEIRYQYTVSGIGKCDLPCLWRASA